MSTQTNKYKVTIFGEHYTLVSDESEQHVKDSAAKVDAVISDLAKQANITDVKKLAILVALQFSSELKHLRESVEVYELEQGHISQLLDEGIATLLNQKD